MQLQRKLIDVGLGAAYSKKRKSSIERFQVWKCSWESFLSKWKISAAWQIKKYSKIAILCWN